MRKTFYVAILLLVVVILGPKLALHLGWIHQSRSVLEEKYSSISYVNHDVGVEIANVFDDGWLIIDNPSDFYVKEPNKLAEFENKQTSILVALFRREYDPRGDFHTTVKRYKDMLERARFIIEDESVSAVSGKDCIRLVMAKADKSHGKKHICLFLDTGSYILYFDGQAPINQLESLNRFMNALIDNLKFQTKG